MRYGDWDAFNLWFRDNVCPFQMRKLEGSINIYAVLNELRVSCSFAVGNKAGGGLDTALGPSHTTVCAARRNLVGSGHIVSAVVF